MELNPPALYELPQPTRAPVASGPAVPESMRAEWAAAQQAVQTAEQDVQRARGYLAKIAGEMPGAGEGVRQWAKQKAQAADELAAHESILARAQAQLQALQTRAAEQSRAAWFGQHNTAVQHWRDELAAGQADVDRKAAELAQAQAAAQQRARAAARDVGLVRRQAPAGITPQYFWTKEEEMAGNLFLSRVD